MKKNKLLRIFWSSNAPWATSGYSTQTNELIFKFAKEGYKVACGCFYGLEGGKKEIDGVMMYPKMNDVWGSDSVIWHGKNWNTDISITFQDIWVLDINAINQFKRWIPYCLDGETLVEFVDSSRIPIKKVVEEKIEGKVWGFKDGKVIKSKILAWQDIPEKMDVYEIKTQHSKILITGNNDIWVKSISKAIPEWKRADCIIPGDMVYCNSNGSLYNQKDKPNRNRKSLFSWLNRWGGDNNYNESQKKEEERGISFNSSIGNDFQYRQSNDRLGWRKSRFYCEQQIKKYCKSFQSCYRKIDSGIKNMLSGTGMGVQLSGNFGSSLTIFDHQKRSSDVGYRVYNIADKRAKDKIQPSVHKRGDRYLGKSQDIEPEIVLAVRKVKAPKRRVYDISTETGNFFANQILVHNCPIDHEPVPRAVLERLKKAYRVITYSQFGQKELERWGVASTYIPHTVDTAVFKPLDKKKCRESLNIPKDMYLFGMVAANKDNPPRKSFQEVIDAFVLFHRNHPNSGMYFSTLIHQQGGFDIEDYWKFVGLPPEKMFFLEPYDQMFNIDRPQLAIIYNAFDCLLAPSQNEGFGLPIIEAQSCGIPVITTDFTAMPELVIPGVTGELVQPLTKRFTPLGSYAAQPDSRLLYQAMEKVYTWEAAKTTKNCRDHIVKNYDTQMIVKERWLPFLERIEKEVYKDLPQDKIDNPNLAT